MSSLTRNLVSSGRQGRGPYTLLLIALLLLAASMVAVQVFQATAVPITQAELNEAFAKDLSDPDNWAAAAEALKQALAEDVVTPENLRIKAMKLLENLKTQDQGIVFSNILTTWQQKIAKLHSDGKATQAQAFFVQLKLFNEIAKIQSVSTFINLRNGDFPGS